MVAFTRVTQVRPGCAAAVSSSSTMPSRASVNVRSNVAADSRGMVACVRKPHPHV